MAKQYLNVGGSGFFGHLRVRDDEGNAIIQAEADKGRVSAGRAGVAGQVRIADASNNATLVFDGATGTLTLGRSGVVGGSIVICSMGTVKATISVENILAERQSRQLEEVQLGLRLSQIERRISSLESAVASLSSQLG